MPFEKGRGKRERSSNSRVFQRRLSTGWGCNGRNRNQMAVNREATDPKKIHMEEHSDYFTTWLRADNILIVTFPFLLSFLVEWVVHLLIIP